MVKVNNYVLSADNQSDYNCIPTQITIVHSLCGVVPFPPISTRQIIKLVEKKSHRLHIDPMGLEPYYMFFQKTYSLI